MTGSVSTGRLCKTQCAGHQHEQRKEAAVLSHATVRCSCGCGTLGAALWHAGGGTVARWGRHCGMLGAALWNAGDSSKQDAASNSREMSVRAGDPSSCRPISDRPTT